MTKLIIETQIRIFNFHFLIGFLLYLASKFYSTAVAAKFFPSSIKFPLLFSNINGETPFTFAKTV